MVRTPCCEEMGLKKGPWTPEEDQILISYIQKFGHANWRALPKQAGLQRCGKSCRLRWTNYLRPDIKRGNFSKEEEETIIKLHQILGNRWSSIAAKLPGRTDNEIKNFWHTHLKKKLQRSTTPTPTTTTTSSTGLILSKLHPININISINNSNTSPVHRIAQSISTSTTIPIVVEPAVQSHIMSSPHVKEPSSITKEEGTGRTVLLSTRNINDHHDGKKYLLPKERVEAKTNKYSSTTALLGPKFQISLNSESSSMDQMYTMNHKSSSNDNNGLSSKNIMNNEDMDFWYNLLVKAGEGSTTS